MRSSEQTVSVGLEDLNVEQAVNAGARSLVIGIAGVGGYLSKSWHRDLRNAAAAGLTIVGGAPIEAGIDRHALQQLLAASARNGIDCALWDLECAQRGSSVWLETGIEPASSIDTAYTIGIVGEQHAAELALKFHHHQTLKLKVDANQSWDWSSFQQFEQACIDMDIALIEQPFKIGEDDCLLNYSGPPKIAADESVQTTEDLALLIGKYDVINIKLDKTGGLPEPRCGRASDLSSCRARVKPVQSA